MAARLAERLRMARLRRFVGRDEERQLFLSALRVDEPPFSVLHVYGPGGIGKTTLLRTFAALCEEENARAVLLDARNVDPNPAAFMNALRTALGRGEHESPLEALTAMPERPVLLIDTFELFAALDTWMREIFLPDLPANAFVVTAGRNAMSATWHTDPGWQELLHEVRLHAFSRDEGRSYLALRDVDVAQHPTVLSFTRGHPLALSLVADLFEQRPALTFEPTAPPDVIKTLVDQFVQHVPGPAHRAAVEACALVRVMNEALLAEMLALPDAHDIFSWLRSVSFIESDQYGLAPHDLAREALVADLRWRNPAWFSELHNRARAYYASRLQRTRGQDQQRVLSDYVYLHRDNPIIKPFLDWQETGSSVPEPPMAQDFPVLRTMVARHEGEDSARIAEYWFERQPESVLVFRGADREPTGFIMLLALQFVSEPDRKMDPATDAALTYLAANAPLRAGERATHFRFWMGAEDYQAVSPMQSLIFLKIAQHYLTTPDLAFTFFPCADAAFWSPFCTYVELRRLEEADYEIGGRRFGVFGHDWRVIPPATWLDHLAQRELETTSEHIEPPAPEDKLLVLDKERFHAAVRDALSAYSRPFEIRENPLLRTRLVQSVAGPGADDADCIEALRTLLKDGADLFQNAPRDAHFHRVLDRTYFRPARSQEQAAEMLDFPISTFRRHLKRAVEQLTDYLWQQETRRGL